MSTIEEAIYARMAANVEITTLVSTRIYPGSVPQTVELPAIAYQKVTSEPILTHSGPTGWARSTVRFTIASDDYAAKKAIAEAVRHCWDAFQGVVAYLAIGLARITDRADIDETIVESALGETVDVLFIHSEV